MDTATGPSSQARAFDPYVHTLSRGLETIHPVAFAAMARHGHRVCAVNKQTNTKFIITTECINKSNSSHDRCQGSIQIVLTEKAPVLYLAKFDHSDDCLQSGRFTSITLEDSPCNDETFPRNYCEYLSKAIEFASTDATAKSNARDEELKRAKAEGFDVPCTPFASKMADRLQIEIGALCNQVIDYYSVPQPKSIWKL